MGEGRPTLFGTGRGSVIDVRAEGVRSSGFTIEGSGSRAPAMRWTRPSG